MSETAKSRSPERSEGSGRLRLTVLTKNRLALKIVRNLWYQTRGEGIAAVDAMLREIANALSLGDTVCLQIFAS
jgi:hypothetical protein